MDNSCQKEIDIQNVNEAIAIISGKWKPAILIYLSYMGASRFSTIKRQIHGITQKMLTAQLRELESDGLISRTIYPEIPPRVEYALTDYGQTLQPVLSAMRLWGESHIAHKLQ